jgi:hypothetical protein
VSDLKNEPQDRLGDKVAGEKRGQRPQGYVALGSDYLEYNIVSNFGITA